MLVLVLNPFEILCLYLKIKRLIEHSNNNVHIYLALCYYMLSCFPNYCLIPHVYVNVLLFGCPVFLNCMPSGCQISCQALYIFFSLLILITTYELGNNISLPDIRKLSSKILNNFHRVTQLVSKGSLSVQVCLMPNPIFFSILLIPGYEYPQRYPAIHQRM